MTDRPISPTLRRLFEAQQALHDRARTVDAEVERRNLEEAAAVKNFKLAYSIAFEAAQGATRAREIKADAVTIELFGQLQNAIAMRRSATEAAKTLHHELDALAAIAHVSNREIKAEMQMGGFA